MADAPPIPRETPDATPRSTSRRILLADAHARSARLAEPLLRRSGFDVEVCGDGQTVLRRAGTRRPYALVLDPDLRGTHGLEVLARLMRQPDPVPVVLTTREQRFRDDHVVRIYPRLVHVPKPYDRRDLEAALAALYEPAVRPTAVGPDDALVRAIADGPTAGVIRTPTLELGLCARGRFHDTFFRILPVDDRRSGVLVAEREAGPEDTGAVFRKLDAALDEAVAERLSPQDLLRRADGVVRATAPGMLLAALALEVDAGREQIELCRAGFHAPLAASPGGAPAEVHLPFGPLLGAPREAGPPRGLRTIRIPFPAGGALVLRSTGALLAVSRQVPDLGQRLFAGLLREHAGSPTGPALEALLGLLGALGVQGPGRDLLLLLVRRR